MTLNDYQTEAGRTINTKLSNDERLVEGALGLNGEAGEAADIIKKYKFQGHPLDMDALIEELGDVLWYIAEIATSRGIPLSTIAAFNLSKLTSRYPHGFDKERSIHREAK